MANYPKFLKRNPSAWGLDFYLATICSCLLFSALAGFVSWLTLLICLMGLGISKVLRRYIDFTVIFVKKVDYWGDL
jgi:hypothetical protein